ncbi:MAG: SH3 domain-containing protein [Chitinophagaceae bacterium]|nr:SH3 domain-containing protein [Chitinophagaceae bacterium]
MKKIILPILLILMTNINVIAQETQPMCAVAKQGLKIYEDQDTASKVLGKIPYGQKINLIDYNYMDKTRGWVFTTGGMRGNWQKVKFNGKTGYIIDCYLFPIPPPQKGVTTLHAYFNQISAIAAKVKVKRPEGQFYLSLDSGIAEYHTKILYKNGMEMQTWFSLFDDYEMHIIPNFSIEQAFLLVQLLQQYPSLISEQEYIPAEEQTYTEIPNSLDKKEFKVEQIEGFTQKIQIQIHQRSNYLEIRNGEPSQAIILYRNNLPQ